MPDYCLSEFGLPVPKSCTGVNYRKHLYYSPGKLRRSMPEISAIAKFFKTMPSHHFNLAMFDSGSCRPN
jgi:hypothetical protein